MQVATFFSLSCDEVTSVNYQSWISVHDYVLRDWKRIPLLLTLERVVEGGTTYNLTSVIANVAHAYEGLSKQKIRGFDHIWGRWGVHIPRYKFGRYCATYQQACTFMVGVHCMAHCTNLVVQTLSGFWGVETYKTSLGNTIFLLQLLPRANSWVSKVCNLFGIRR